MDIVTKRCFECKAEKPAGEFYVKDSKTGRLYPRCKACHSAWVSARYYADHEKNKKKGREIMARRLAEKPEAVREYNRRWRAANPEKHKATSAKHEAKRKPQQKAYREANREKTRARTAEYRERNRERLKEYNAAYYRANRDACNERIKKCQQARPDYYRALYARNANRRRFRLEQCEGSYTPQEWMALKEKYDHRCLMCGRREPEIKLTVDHIVAVSKGGPNTIDNIQCLCRPCNSRKKAQALDLRCGAV